MTFWERHKVRIIKYGLGFVAVVGFSTWLYLTITLNHISDVQYALREHQRHLAKLAQDLLELGVPLSEDITTRYLTP